MINKFYFVLLLGTSLLLTACSQQRASKPIPLKPLKEISAKQSTIKTKTLWQNKTESLMGDYSIHPYVSTTAVFVAGGKTASAWNKKSGQQLWKATISETISAGINGSISPNVSQVFLGTNTGKAIALDSKTGKILWIEQLSGEVLSVSPSKAGRVVFRTHDGKLHGLSSRTGELAWQRSQRTPSLTSLGAGVPIISGSNIIAGFDNGKVAAYNLQTGKPLWEVTLAFPRGISDLDRIVDIDGNIQIVDAALFASTMNGTINGIDTSKGIIAWSKDFSSPTGISVNPQGLYSSDTEGNVWKFKPQSGTTLWKIDDLQGYEPTLPVIVGASLIVVGDKKGNLHWINSQTGKFIARTKGDHAGYSIAPVVEGNTIYTFGKSGLLSKIHAN